MKTEDLRLHTVAAGVSPSRFGPVQWKFLAPHNKFEPVYVKATWSGDTVPTWVIATGVRWVANGDLILDASKPRGNPHPDHGRGLIPFSWDDGFVRLEEAEPVVADLIRRAARRAR